MKAKSFVFSTFVTLDISYSYCLQKKVSPTCLEVFWVGGTSISMENGCLRFYFSTSASEYHFRKAEGWGSILNRRGFEKLKQFMLFDIKSRIKKPELEIACTFLCPLLVALIIWRTTGFGEHRGETDVICSLITSLSLSCAPTMFQILYQMLEINGWLRLSPWTQRLYSAVREPVW